MERYKHVVDWTDQLTNLYAENRSVHEALNEVRSLQDDNRSEYRTLNDKLSDRVAQNADTLKEVKDDIKNVTSLLEKLTSKLSDNAVPPVIPLPEGPVSSTMHDVHDNSTITSAQRAHEADSAYGSHTRFSAPMDFTNVETP